MFRKKKKLKPVVVYQLLSTSEKAAWKLQDPNYVGRNYRCKREFYNQAQIIPIVRLQHKKKCILEHLSADSKQKLQFYTLHKHTYNENIEI